MKLFNASNIVIVIIILFLLGLSVGVYNGDELRYDGFIMNNTNSTINTGVSKILDGGLTLAYELANIVGEGAREQNIDLNKIVNLFIKLFWIGVVLVFLTNATKVFLYIYILKQEINMAKKEKELLGIEDDKRLLEYRKIEKRERIWYYIIIAIVLLVLFILWIT